MTTADRFALEWQPILGAVRRQLQRPQLVSAFDAFIQVPANRCVSAIDNGMLMKAISLTEVITALRALSGTKQWEWMDSITIFKDNQEVMAPAIVAIGNELLQGGQPPPSF
uniref:Uncharacterized protein n=1 Tax=Peronospora matthiolae TaxID=2874970 RepID=A0AAV1V5A9_9STRA